MPETPQEPRRKLSCAYHAGGRAGHLFAGGGSVCLLAGGAHPFPQNVYETALPITISDTIEADGVLLFNETCISGSGTLGYLVADGERVFRQALPLQSCTAMPSGSVAPAADPAHQPDRPVAALPEHRSHPAGRLLKERSGALYDLMDALDTDRYSDVDGSADAYLLAQNKLWITTGDTAGFSDQIALLAQQAQTVQAQLGNPTQITAPQTGYFVRAASSGRLNAGAADILAQSPEQLKAYLDSDPEIGWTAAWARSWRALPGSMPGCAPQSRPKSCWAQDGKPLRTAWRSAFPARGDAALGHRHRGDH